MYAWGNGRGGRGGGPLFSCLIPFVDIGGRDARQTVRERETIQGEMEENNMSGENTFLAA